MNKYLNPINYWQKLISYFDIWEQKKVNYLINKKQCVSHNNIDMEFFTPNPLSRYRATTFSTKEPETLAWIDSFDENTIFWDVGANIGLYSVYAAKTKNSQVFAFEPSVFNLEFLAKNIHVNKLQRNVTIFPLALSDVTGSNLFKMNNPVWGGALSAFGVDFDYTGKKFNTSFEYKIIGLSADNVVDIFNITKPDYMKIDVDGIEHIILSGATNILKTIQSVLVEIDESFLKQNDNSTQYLSDSGLILKERHGVVDGSSICNQLWVRE